MLATAIRLAVGRLAVIPMALMLWAVVIALRIDARLDRRGLDRWTHWRPPESPPPPMSPPPPPTPASSRCGPMST